MESKELQESKIFTVALVTRFAKSLAITNIITFVWLLILTFFR